jgi:hypothetical protein
MISQFDGKCRTCGKPYAKGDEIYWNKLEGAHHLECKPTALPDTDETPAQVAERLGFK